MSGGMGWREMLKEWDGVDRFVTRSRRLRG